MRGLSGKRAVVTGGASGKVISVSGGLTMAG